MGNTFVRTPLSIHRRLALESNPVCIAGLADGGYLLNFNKDTHVIRLDKDLNQIWRKALNAQTEEYVNCALTASPDGKYLALSGYESVRVLDMEGNLVWIFVHDGWDKFQGTTCTFSADSELIWFVAPASSSMENDALHVVRLSDHKVVDVWMMNGNREYNYTIHTTPDKNVMMIDGSAGQDSTIMYLAQLQGCKIVCEELTECDDRIMGTFSPNGKEFVTAPHYDEDIIWYSFPDVAQSASMQQEALFNGRDEYPTTEDSDSLEYVVLHINNKTVLAFTRYGRLLLIDRDTLQCTGELLPEGCEIRAYDMAGRPTTDPKKILDYAGEIVTVTVNNQHQLLITHNSGEVRLYNLPEQLH